MPQSKRDIQSLLDEANTSPRHRFGQNFMIDQNIVRLVADAGEVAAGERVIEVGPGTGTLTEELLSRGADVVAVEIDRDLAGLLRKRLGDNPRFRLIEGDALDGKHGLNSELLEAIRSAGKPVKLVANLPYNIASPLVIELLIAGVQTLAFVVQKEVALRLAASAGEDDYGPLTVMAQLLSKVEILRKLSPDVFWPAPQVDSSLVRMRRDDLLGGEARSAGQFVHAIFSYRRKTLRKALAQAGLDGGKILSITGFDGQRRPETFTPAEVLSMFRASQTT
jgi:16S rRNA (adenine1518-N6/adenine1519-N6)-dimethyltransferase